MSDDKELDLRSSIRNLKSVVKTLDATNFNFNLNVVKTFADKIDVETIGIGGKLQCLQLHRQYQHKTPNHYSGLPELLTVWATRPVTSYGAQWAFLRSFIPTMRAFLRLLLVR